MKAAEPSTWLPWKSTHDYGYGGWTPPKPDYGGSPHKPGHGHDHGHGHGHDHGHGHPPKHDPKPDHGGGKPPHKPDPVPCFTPGTTVMTPGGAVPVESLRPGQRIMTRDSGMQVLKWVGRRDLTAEALTQDPSLRPILLRQGALGDGLPARDMLVSPQHRFLVRGAHLALEMNEPEMLVPALALRNRAGVSTAALEPVSYIHLLFDRHEVVLSDHVWTESFQPAARMVSRMDGNARRELAQLFPALVGLKTKAAPEDAAAFPAARPVLKARELNDSFEIG